MVRFLGEPTGRGWTTSSISLDFNMVTSEISSTFFQMIKIQIKWKSRRLSFLCMRVSAQKFASGAYFCSGVHRRRPRRNEGGKLHLEIFASSSQMPVWISVHPTANGQNKLQVSQTLFDDPLGNIPASNLFIGSRRPRPKTQVKAILNCLDSMRSWHTDRFPIPFVLWYM